MDGSRIDDLSRLLARPASRRQTLRAVAAVALGGLACSTRPDRSIAAEEFGCCKCSGSNVGCMDVQSQAACNTHCGTAVGIFSTKHTCTKGGSGTTNQCRRKTGLEPDEACEEDELVCTPAGSLTTSPVTAAALDLAARSGDGWALQEATACFDGDACRAGGLFGAVPGDEVERLAARVIDGYRQRSARRTVTPEVPSDTTEHLFFRFSQSSEVAEFEANIRGLVPPDATDRSEEVQVDGVSFAFGVTGPTADIPDPAAETVSVFAKSGNVAVLSTTTSTSGDGVQGYTDQEYKDLIESFAREPLNLDLELLVASAISISGSRVQPEAESSVTVLDGQTLPRDGETADQLDFRLLTDVGTIHALRTSFTVESAVGPLNVVHEVRELESAETAENFTSHSLDRVTKRFGESLFTFVVTEFDNLGEQGTGFIYLLNQENGGVTGGVTGYARLGNLVGVTNVNIRTDAPPTPDQLALIQDGRFFACPGVAILDRQLQVWLGTSSERSLEVVDEDEAFCALFPVRRE